MKLIVGLGNPGEKYDGTRHNIGFEVIDYLAKEYNAAPFREKFQGLITEIQYKDDKIFLLKPQTYMNLSGESVRAVMDFYKLDPENDIIVISDDINLATGRIRIRAQGSAGGHNGLKSIINHAGTQKFKRVRVGVGANEGNLVNHVLGKFSKGERVLAEQGIKDAASAVEVMILEDINTAMNKFN
jgi:PTH1 family peptidyl-tRNA hydrolase